MILEEAKQKVYQSPIVKYIKPEKIEKAFSKVYVYENEEEFLKVHGKSWTGGRLEGFNRNGISYIGPQATPHTIIHEVLHTLSSEFDKKGHRIVNGIMGKEGENFANSVNEGLTDYLACKISGEKPRNYRIGHEFFGKMDSSISQYYQDDEILYRIYLNHDDKSFKDFLNSGLGEKNGAHTIYENFLYFSSNEIEGLTNRISKNVKKEIRKRPFRKIVQFLKGKWKGKGEILQLEEGSKQDFREQYKTEFDGTIDQAMQERITQTGKKVEKEKEI